MTNYYKYYKCRNYERTKKWMEFRALSPAIAAQLYAEACYMQDGETVTVMNHGKYLIRISCRAVVYKK